MPFDRAEPAAASGPLPLARVTRISRPVSTPEYYHASVGTSPHTLDGPRIQAYFVKGLSTLEPAQWQRAWDQVVAAHPGTRLRLVGRRARARWESDGPAPPLRVVENCEWDTSSQRGAEFIDTTPLSLERGPNIELIVANLVTGSSLVVLRCHHAVTDGMGSMYLLEELFRALREEPLQGANADFSDVDLMLKVGAKHSSSRHIRTTAVTGDPMGDEIGDEWRRISLGAPGKNLLARTAAALADFAHLHSTLPVLIAVPVNLRRHQPGLRSSTNFSNMLFVRLDRGDGPETFAQRLNAMLEGRMETVYSPSLDLFKWLPLTWCDRLLSRTKKNYRTRRSLETALISNLGRFDSQAFSCAGFDVERIFMLPLTGSVFTTLACVGDQVEMTINLPRVLAGNGRFDALIEHLQTRLLA